MGIVNAPPTHPERDVQQRYARVLASGTRMGLALLVAAFALYVLDLLPARVPLDHLGEFWSLPLAEFLRQTGAPTGWGWVGLARYGDFASLAGIALLASCSIPALLAVMPLFARRGDRAYAVLCLLEVGVLVLAASGVLTGGH
jgi:hypothetical protein